MLGSHSFWATIPVADMERAKAFYRDRLGLDPVKETDQWVTYRSGDSVFQLYPSAGAGSAGHTLGGWVVDDLDAAVAALRADGVDFEEYDLPGLRTVDGIATLGEVERAAWFRDSEGNILAVSEFLTDPLG
ncbi:MAG: VOC family protein [Actinomycetota bacterium]|nr:VOC family protein [Actinomycetota bacterium]